MKLLTAVIEFLLADTEVNTLRLQSLSREIDYEKSAIGVIVGALDFFILLSRNLAVLAIANVLIEVADIAGKIYFKSR